MLNLNDDMDDLIRQAAEDYPLKTEGKDWDKVVGAMQSETEITQPGKRENYWWMLLLLLPLMVAVPYLFKNNNTEKPITYSNTDKANEVEQKQNGGGAQPKNDESTDRSNESTDKSNGATDKNNESTDKSNESTEPITSNGISGTQLNGVAGKEKQNGSQLNKQFGTKTTINNGDNISANHHNRITKGNITEKGNASISNNTTSGRDLVVNNPDTNSINNNKTQAAISGLAISQQNNKNTGGKENTLATADSNSQKVALTPQKDSVASAKKVDIKHTTPIKTKGLYVGLGAGLDVTTIKFQKINDIGYTTSFIVGYRFNNKWSLESGLMWDSKKYYSAGDYYNPKEPIPADYNLHYLNGICNMFEIPLNVKYDFKSRQLSGFFVTAGLSSYIMKKESYVGFFTQNSDPSRPGYDYSYVYKNSTNNIFSVGNISGGYQFIFKNNGSLRIEPYLRVPLTGLGVGRMPFLSTGISTAYTLPLR